MLAVLGAAIIVSESTMSERREFQRLHLAKPILALLNSKQNALILDIGVGGGLIEHHGPAKHGDRFDLAFRWKGEDVRFLCDVMRSRVVRERPAAASVTSHSGVHFVEAIGDSAAHLTDLMATFVGKVLAAQRANAAGDGGGPHALTLEQIGGARRARSLGWLTYRLRDGAWKVSPSSSPHQPTDGFTVAAHEVEEELQTLCSTYESADEEGRRLIRLVAELSPRTVDPVSR
jgi:hypothetical protein